MGQEERVLVPPSARPAPPLDRVDVEEEEVHLQIDLPSPLSFPWLQVTSAQKWDS